MSRYGVWFLASLCAVSFLAAFFSPWKSVGVIIGVLSFFFLLRSWEYVLYGLILYFPLEPFLLKFVSNEIYVYARYFPEILIYSLCVVLFIRKFHKKYSQLMRYGVLFFFLFVGTATVSAMINHTPFLVASLGIRQYVRFILVIFIIIMMRPSRIFSRNVCLLLFVLALGESSIGIFQAVIGYPMDMFLIPEQRKFLGDIQLTGGTTQFWESGQRIFATMGRYDQLGTFLSLVLLLLTSLQSWQISFLLKVIF